jgi:hypothetical protein
MIKRHDKIKRYLIYVVVALIVVIAILLFVLIRGNEFNLSGKQEHFFNTTDKVIAQENALRCAHELYNDFASSKIKISSQCLGTCFGYVVDFVHVPRIAEDDNAQNQCSDYLSGKVSNFIELDKNGNVVRVFEPALE